VAILAWPRIFGMAAAVLFISLAAGQTIDEYQVKAGFVANLAHFVEWPPEAFKNAHDPITICVLGRNPFGHVLTDLVEGKAVDDRYLVVRNIADVGGAAGCHILFIASSEHLRFRSILAKLKDRSILSIGDTNDFIGEGGVANLRIESGKVRIEINAEAGKEKNLRISSRLMQLAKIVR
jgi:hypothetical protein